MTDLANKPVVVKHRFTYQVELAGYEFGQADKKGEINYLSFLRSFEEFPWIEQIQKANEGHGVSPTLTVDDNERNEALWVSAMGDQNGHTFLLGHVHPKQVRGFFGLGKLKTTKWIEIYLTQDREVVKESFGLFFDGNANGLRLRFEKLEKYDDMESAIQD